MTCATRPTTRPSSSTYAAKLRAIRANAQLAKKARTAKYVAQPKPEKNENPEELGIGKSSPLTSSAKGLIDELLVRLVGLFTHRSRPRRTRSASSSSRRASCS